MSQQALDGIVVVEFAAFAAGPCIGKYMANFGAYVVRVESASRPDGFRAHYPPFKDNIKGVNRSGVFAFNNDSVYSVGVNLKAPGGLDIAKKLASKADVIIENFTPGTMRKLGLGYEDLAKLNPRLVMLSTCNMGQTGPRAHHPGFGSQLTSLSGFTNLAGEPGGEPVIVYGPYIDYVAVGYGYVAVMAALEHRRRTGRGQYIDLAQYENGIQFIGPAILQQQLLGSSPSRQGNRHPQAAPHNAYPCAEPDSWCAIGVYDDAEWQRLLVVMDHPAWATSIRFASQLSRKQNETELDALLSEWTRTQQAAELMQKLQTAGVHAAKVNNMRDLFSDSQLAHRRFWRTVHHKEVGDHQAEMPAYDLSLTPFADPSPDPCLCEHTEAVLKKLLGMTDSEIAQLASQGAVELETPVATSHQK